MTSKRWITEMGMGVDVHGWDYTKAVSYTHLTLPTILRV